MKILIVDDSKAMRMIVARTLRQAGYGDATLVEAGNGREALTAIETSQPNLVLCDWNMPEMSGIELLRALRSANNSIPFGFVTSEASQEMKDTAAAAGAQFLITKPFTPKVFEETIGSMGA
ncbi:MAG: response regulator [Deltaproteobacteria bacterium]|nr:response regulator [Deltaproteobacteria bacterium]